MCYFSICNVCVITTDFSVEIRPIFLTLNQEKIGKVLLFSKFTRVRVRVHCNPRVIMEVSGQLFNASHQHVGCTVCVNEALNVYHSTFQRWDYFYRGRNLWWWWWMCGNHKINWNHIHSFIYCSIVKKLNKAL